MRTRRFVAAGIVVAMVTLSAASLSSATGPNPPAPLDQAAFELIAGSDLAHTAAIFPEPAASRGPAPLIADFANPVRSFAARPEPRLVVAPRVVTTAKAKPRPAFQAAADGTVRASGPASWYCKAGVSICHHSYPGGMYAAAGPKLRVGNWRGRVVQVCGNGSCVSVKLIDWCACGGGRVIDLYSDAFRRLAPLSKGTVRVTVSW
jgi:rare lipoprotein A (RlpA)-like double-psi beta-barrel protein